MRHFFCLFPKTTDSLPCIFVKNFLPPRLTGFIGVNSGLKSEEIVHQLSAAGTNWERYLQSITTQVAVMHAICGVLIPTLMVVMMTRFYGQNKSWTEGLSILPFTIFGGLAFTVPYALTGVYLGAEFPSIIGAMAGLAVVVPAAKGGFLAQLLLLVRLLVLLQQLDF